MKSDNAKQRKKSRIRPYQIKPDKKNQKKPDKKINNNERKNDVPQVAFGVKVLLISKSKTQNKYLARIKSQKANY